MKSLLKISILLEEVLNKIRTNLKFSKKGFYESVSGGDNELETKRKKVLIFNFYTPSVLPIFHAKVKVGSVVAKSKSIRPTWVEKAP